MQLFLEITKMEIIDIYAMLRATVPITYNSTDYIYCH